MAKLFHSRGVLGGKMADFSENSRGAFLDKMAVENGKRKCGFLINGSRMLVSGLLSLLRLTQSITNVKLQKIANKISGKNLPFSDKIFPKGRVLCRRF